jgi:5'-nucleotidase
MNHVPRWIAAALIGLVFTGCDGERSASAASATDSSLKAGTDKDRLVVLFTTDEHSHLFGFAPERDDFPAPSVPGEGLIKGGVVRRAAIFAAERAAAAQSGATTITVSAGDFSQGTLAAATFLMTASDITLMSRLGYDAVALGNHEFDTSPAGLAYAISLASQTGEVPPFVLTNVIFSAQSAADDGLEALYGPGKAIAPYRIVTRGGMRIGLVAVMGPGAARDAGPFAAPVVFSTANPSDHEAALAATIDAVKPVVASLRSDRKLDVVIVLGHGGVGETGGAPGDDERLAAAVPGIDLVVSGHSHRSPGQPILVTDPDGRQVPVLQVSPFGAAVGHAELIVKNNKRPVFDAAHTRFIPVDDRIVAAGFPELQAVVDQVLGALEDEQNGAPSPLERILAAVEGAPVAHDPSHPGDLYFRQLGHTSFDVPGLPVGETNVANLDTDAMLAMAQALAGPTELALQVRGAIRADLRKGATGALSFADIFATVALGIDPTDGSPGYPLARFSISTAELRAALEVTLQAAMLDPDYQLLPAGLKLEYDPTRALFDPANPAGPGWITKLSLVNADLTETGLYDASVVATGGWLVDPFSLRSVATTYYVAAFAASFGIVLRDDMGQPIAPADALLRVGTGGPSVKDYQSLASYIHALGELPSIYDPTTAEGHVPRRVICTGSYCP